MRNLIEQQYQLTQAKERLAINAASIDIRKYNAHVHDFFQYPLGVSFIGVEKPLVAGWQEAFPVLFILNLYYQNDWICSEQERTSPDQLVVGRMPENAPESGKNRLEQELAGTKWVCSLFTGAFYDKFFGETGNYYFFAESGVYDYSKLSP